MNKIEGVPFHGTLPSKHVMPSQRTFSDKAWSAAGTAAYYGGMAALGIAGRGFARGAVQAGRAAVLGRAARSAQLVRAMGA